MFFLRAVLLLFLFLLSFTSGAFQFRQDYFTFTTLLANSAEDKLMIFLLFFPRKKDLTFHANKLDILPRVL